MQDGYPLPPMQISGGVLQDFDPLEDEQRGDQVSLESFERILGWKESRANIWIKLFFLFPYSLLFYSSFS